MKKTFPALIVFLAFSICGLLVAGTAGAADTVTDLEEYQVVGLHKVLRKFKKSGAISREISPSGALVRTRFTVTGCPKLTDPFNESWSCYAEVKGTFRIKSKYHQSSNVSGGSAQIVSGANGDKMSFEERVEYAWDATDQELTVFVTYGSTASGVVKRWGGFNVRGKTVHKVTTETKDFDASGTFGDLFSLGVDVTKTEAKKTARLKFLASNLPWTGTTGPFHVSRQPGSNEIVFATEMNWLTDSMIDYTEEVPVTTTSCNNSVNYDVDFNQLESGGSITASQDEGVDCRTTSESLTARIKWLAKPAFEEQGGQQNEVGQRAYNRIVVQKLSTDNYKAFYQASFDSLVSWSLDVETDTGATLGGGFEVGSNHQISGEIKGPVYSISY